MLDLRGPIPRMIPSRGLEVVKELARHLFVWHNEDGMNGGSDGVQKISPNEDVKEEVEVEKAVKESLTDPQSFTIPHSIGKVEEDKALSDLGASISLMPYSMFVRLDLGELKPTRMCIKLANKSTQYPKEIAENVIVQIDKFVFSVGFIILEMEEDSKVSIILGRPFLATAHAMIDVFNKKISLEVGKEKITFDVEKSMKFSTSVDDTCHSFSLIDLTIHDHVQETLPKDQLNSFLIKPIEGYQPSNNETGSINLWDEERESMKTEEKFIPKLKELPSHLEYDFLNGRPKLLVIISLLLSKQEKTSLLQVLTKHKTALAWKVTDIKGISPWHFLKKKLTTAPMIIAPDWNIDFELMCDASDYDVGAVLGQRIDKKFQPIYYASKTINDAQEHYTTTEKELVAVVYAFDKFWSYLGAENLAADHLSRLENPELEEIDKEAIIDSFPDEHLMAIQIRKPEKYLWYADYANFLVSKVMPRDMTYCRNQ
ncbi:reverse transcriptase domain-containing protein [Tanacetum coccineum]